jgi:hypothetical protein
MLHFLLHVHAHSRHLTRVIMAGQNVVGGQRDIVVKLTI